jgi:iron complex outermembrane recepter protein
MNGMKHLNMFFSLNNIITSVIMSLLVLVMAQTVAIGAPSERNVLEKVVTLQIRHMSLSDALVRIEVEADVKFVYSPQLIQADRLINIRARNARLGILLERLFKNSGIEFEAYENQIVLTAGASLHEIEAIEVMPIEGVVKDAQGEAIPGATVMVKGKQRGAVTDVYGRFKIDADENDVLTISSTGYNSQEITVGRQTNLDITLTDNAAVLAEVAVVGSRSTAVRTAVETIAPVDVLTAKDLQLTGQTEPTQQLQFMAPSFVSNRQTVSDGTDHIDPASLRGLGPDQVLVLVNGKRRYQTALVNINGTVGKGSVGSDLNSIPAASIERIEVLRDGAASQYGSDAIAGVINIVTKKNTDFQINTHFGQQYVGDGRTMQLGASKGFTLGKNGGFINFSVDARLRDSTNRAGTFLGTVFSTNATTDADLVRQNGGWNRENNMHVGNSNVNNYGGVVNFGLPVGKTAEIYATGMLGLRSGKGSGFYRYPKQTTQVVPELYPRGFLPNIESTINDRSLIVGIRNNGAKGWRTDLSNVIGANSFRFDVTNSNNASMGTQSPRSFYCGTIINTQNTTNLDIAKDFGEKIGLKSFNVAFGGELRIDNYQIKAGDEASWRDYDNTAAGVGKVGGAQVFPGYQPTNELNESRTVAGVYADIETDLTDRFLVNAAGRFENYSDFGSAFAGKLAMRYKFAEQFSLRGTVSNGFRAPSIHQFYFNNTSTQFQVVNGVLTPSNTLTVRNDSPVAQALGIDPLEAERSVNLSLGVTSRIADMINITIDAYQIDIKDRIALAGLFRRSTPAVAAVLNAANIDREIGVAQAFANILDTRTRGLDIVIAASPKLGPGTLDLTFAANFNQTDITAIKGTSKLDAGVVGQNPIQFDRIEQSRVQIGNPRDKFTFGANYRMKKLGFNLRATRFGEVGVWSNAPNPLTPATDDFLDEFFAPRIVTDFSVNYALTKNIRIIVGANNLLNVYPEKQRFFRDNAGALEGNITYGNATLAPLNDPFYGNTGEGRFVYSRNATQFGANGGYWFVSVNATF